MESEKETLAMPIAICGMGMRLPGGIRNDTDLYNFLVRKQDARSEIPKSRFNIDAYHDGYSKPGTIITRHGYFLEDVDLTKFDLSMFSMTAAEVTRLDPSQRLLLEVTREAFDSAGEANFRGKNIGTFTSLYGEDWSDLQTVDVNDFGPYQLMGKMDFMQANRISYEYDLKGPSVTVKTACSSSGVALHQALQSIRLGEISAAIVATSNLILTPGLAVAMSGLMGLSPTGSCNTFDASADGFARAEAVSCLYIKRLDEAIRDGNPVRAIIRASGSNADGKTSGLTLPNPAAHEALIRQTYKNAGLDFDQTAMVECHGTGTAVGDPLEASAVAKCFGHSDTYIGSVKPNLGHSEGASAISSILKAVVSLENQIIIPNIKFVTPNPAIPWDKAKLKVPTEPLSWPQDRWDRISINTFGIGGSNAHFIIDSARSFGISSPSFMKIVDQLRVTAGKKHLLLFSANSAYSLKAVCEGHQRYLDRFPSQLESLVYTLSEHREHLKLRAFGITDGSVPFSVSNQTQQAKRPGKIAFVFTGQGAQRMDGFLGSLEHAPVWTIEEILLHCGDASIIRKSAVSMPVCTALQVALVDVFAAGHITPAAVVGHSSGEIAAAYAAGVLSRREAITISFYRGYMCNTLPQTLGGMAAVGLGRDEVQPYLVPGVQIACENSSQSTTISGDLKALERCLAAIKADHPAVQARRLHVDLAYHSGHMRKIGSKYSDILHSHIEAQPPRIPFFSSADVKRPTGAGDFGPRYWQANLESPVLFHSAVKRLLEDCPDASIHLEIGPHSALSGPLRQVYRETGASPLYLPSLTRHKDDEDAILETMGHLYCADIKVKLPVSVDAQVLTHLPPYPWHYDGSYWSETRVMSNWRQRRYPSHDILGSRVAEAGDLEPMWRNILRIKDIPWLRDHNVCGDIIFPAAAYVAMAGEAVLQLGASRDTQTGYTIRELHLSAAMLLREDKSVEVMVTLRPRRLTAKEDSKWYEFTVVSHNGSAWTRHCRGLVISGRACPMDACAEFESQTRRVASSHWYKALAKMGLNYGPTFTGLQDITSAVSEQLCSATVTDKQEECESWYPMHPTTIDIIFQSWLVAQTTGLDRKLTGLSLPTFIEELYIGCAMSATIKLVTTGGDQQCSSDGLVNGQTAFRLRGLRGSPLENTETNNNSLALTVQRLQWKPHVDFMDPARLMKPTLPVKSQMALLERLQLERFEKPGYPLVEDSPWLVRLDKETRQKLILDHLQELEATEARPLAVAIWRSCSRLADIVQGSVNFLDLLLQDNLLQQIYDWMNDLLDASNYFSLLGHSQPQLKILEIGAGTGGLTSKILQSLRSETGERLYLSYTFTDVSSGFFPKARDRFKDYYGIKYCVLDIAQNPMEQGFKEAEFDLIVASNVLHATPILVETLRNCRKLLQPNGRLYLQELSPITKSANFVMLEGLFAGWWLGSDDGRPNEPYIFPEQWDTRLREAGFDGPAIEQAPARRVTLLTASRELGPLAQATQRALRRDGYKVDRCVWKIDAPPADQDMISFVDFEDSTQPLLRDVADNDLKQLLDMMDHVSQSTLLWLTKPAQIRCEDPYHAQILGLARTARAELAVDFATMELDRDGDAAASAVAGVMRKLQLARQVDGDVNGDMEFAFADGAVHVSRLHWFSAKRALADVAPAGDAKRLVVGQRGMLQSLQWRRQRLAALESDQVRVRMCAIGINFRELMAALGIVRFPGAEEPDGSINAFGDEGVGWVTAIGAAVNHFKVGDRVMCMGSTSPGFATEVQRRAGSCILVPDRLSDQQAATMAVAYSTALYCLVDKANLQRGQSLLIHSAAGGVGIAAIHVARWLGADIYVTAGTKDKVEFLERELGVPRERIFSSRDDGFVGAVMAATAGVGVHVVLNSLSGDLLHASWQCVAPWGIMVEIGKRDVLGHGQLAMSRFAANRTFSCVDLSAMMGNEFQVQRLLEQIVDLYQQGHFHPICPITVFDAVDVEDAYRHMQQGQHMGKIVVSLSEQDALPLAPSMPEPAFRGNASYLLVGGLGGLGRAIAPWMVSHGARSLIFLSRSAGRSTADHDFFEELREAGCVVQCFSGDVADAELVRAVVDQARLPIAGVMQMAMVLSDAGVMDMDASKWAAAVRPKVDGTWNLHHLLPRDLDFFVLFSSIAGLLGYFGQSNYSSASAFLDAFVQYRQALGLVASVIDIGPIENVGFVARTEVARSTIAANAQLVSEQDFLDIVQLAVAPLPRRCDCATGSFVNSTQLANVPWSVKPIMDPQNATLWKRDPRMAMYRIIEKAWATGSDNGPSNSIQTLISSLGNDRGRLDNRESSEVLARAIASRASEFLMKDKDLDLSQTLAAVGVDSLVAIELRNWWKQALGVEVSVLELMNGGNMLQLGDLAVNRLKKRYSSTK
ncbi:polyketide synthase dehydratase [Hirsutella rhossiliensis]|uniref:Polyketide synthase dehydratase domain-containing protein n=1 Tax=Hirsutella rhossiliensis TaxID=111463 RepID=A0A9P8N6K7_9HYPO|nr:polyketide synthase dehydratase domain-containing protein [Hirsutella rhossiliensis]KAH0967765.1 polyketide synthase dehydratase domain-containing protein [Hirsutella rhossiliensis]